MKSPQLVPCLMEKQTTFPRDQHYKNMRFPPSPQHLTESASPGKQARKRNRSPTGIGQESLSVWHGFILWTFLRHTHTNLRKLHDTKSTHKINHTYKHEPSTTPKGNKEHQIQAQDKCPGPTHRIKAMESRPQSQAHISGLLPGTHG